MNARHFSRVFSALALCVALLLTVGPALAAVEPIPLDILKHGNPPLKNGWISEKEYEDESIHIVMDSARRKPKTSHGQTTCRWVRIKIADPSQLRTALSNDSYDDPALARSVSMAKAVNAVVAMNGDFCKYNYNRGYVVRQGVFYRDALDGSRDVLIIDDKGDFSFVKKATSEEMQQKNAELEEAGRTVVNAFCFGPVLVVDGEVQDTTFPEMESHLATQRIALCQLGELEYAIMEIDGGNGYGMSLNELATYITIIFPECKVAYNMDGGGSTHLIVNGKLVHKTANSRTISDIVYFASAVSEE